MAKRDQTGQVIVLGGGPAGLTAALALSRSGFAITLIDASPPPESDRRTSALMTASITLLDNLGVWTDCVGAAAPLKRIRIIDDTGRLVRAPTVEFDAGEIGEQAFGWNIPNAVLVAAMRRACSADAMIERIETRAAGIRPGTHGVAVDLEDGRVVTAPLLVAADGRASPSRAAARIRTREWSYDQAALVMNLAHDRPHDDVSTEFHRQNGPFTLVPLPGHASSLVWVETRRVAGALAEMDDASLQSEIERLSHRLLGRVRINGPRGMFALSGLRAERFAARRIALVGEAAHVVPPIGAQGLNLGLRDAAAIAEAVAGHDDPGGPDVMRRYDESRRLDVLSRTGGVDLLNRSLLSGFLPVQAARAAGIAAIGGVGPLRRLLMREGVAPMAGLPRLMRPDPPPVR